MYFCLKVSAEVDHIGDGWHCPKFVFADALHAHFLHRVVVALPIAVIADVAY